VEERGGEEETGEEQEEQEEEVEEEVEVVLEEEIGGVWEWQEEKEEVGQQRCNLGQV